MTSLKLFIAVLGSLLSLQAFAKSGPFPPSPHGTLFAGDSTLNIEIKAPLKKLFNDFELTQKKSERLRVSGTVSYRNDQGQEVTVPAIFKVKGNSSTECAFKKVELKFKKEDTVGTLFAGMKSVDLNTHCNRRHTDEVDYNNHREGVLYKIAKLLQVPTYQVRLARAKYVETGLPESNGEQIFQAIFVEDLGDFLHRLNAQEIKTESLERLSAYAHKEIDNEDIKRLRVFNEMIGNEDYVYPGQFMESEKGPQVTEGEILWNLKVIAVDAKHWVPLTHDFNLAIILQMNQFYGVDYYREMLDDEKIVRRIRQEYKARAPQIYKLIQANLHNDPEGSEAMIKALKSYFGHY
jgi:hypothetical protein